MKLLDRYIFKKFFFTFLVILTIFALFIIIMHASDHESYFKKHHLTFYEVCNYYCCALPVWVNPIVPISAFGATVWITTKLRSKMIALLSGGISLHRIIRPYLIIALLLTGAHLYYTGWLLPNVDKKHIVLKTKYFNFGGPFGAPIHLIAPLDGPTIYFQTLDIKQYDVDNHTGYDIILRTDENSTDTVEELRAKKMQWDPIAQTWILQHWQKKLFVQKMSMLVGQNIKS